MKKKKDGEDSEQRREVADSNLLNEKQILANELPLIIVHLYQSTHSSLKKSQNTTETISPHVEMYYIQALMHQING